MHPVIDENSASISGITEGGPTYRLFLDDNKLTEQELNDLNEIYKSFS